MNRAVGVRHRGCSVATGSCTGRYLGVYSGRLASSSAAGVPPPGRGLQRSGGTPLAWSSITMRITASNSCARAGSRSRVVGSGPQ